MDKRFLSHTIFIAFFDIVTLYLAWALTLWIRFDFSFEAIPEQYSESLIQNIPFIIVATLVVFYFFKLYHSVWSFVSIHELFQIVYAYIFLIPVYIAIIAITQMVLPKSCFVMAYLLSFAGTTCIRFGYRFLRLFCSEFTSRTQKETTRTLIVGAGRAGTQMMRELNTANGKKEKVVCFIDDNSDKTGKNINGVPIVGNRHQIHFAVEKYKVDKIVLAIPIASGANRKAILEICRQTDCDVYIIPAFYQLANGEAQIAKVRPIEIEDLLGRDPVEVNNKNVFKYLNGKCVMVTGGGGSIGSELCRQIAQAEPAQLIIFDVYENNAYDIQMELEAAFKNLDIQTLIGSVRNVVRLEWILKKYRPDVVFHAAAHKHVPLMEDSPNESIKNNVLGTYNMARLSGEYGVDKFVLISTDKAVNPTNIMGASKRLCEMVMQMMSRKGYATHYSAVRFGNVLGSNGSVIPLFKKQIAKGGPITVTDPNIIRYFMTIPEAVSLVLQAGYYAHDGEIFVLDMGEPVKIVDMAKNLIRLSGLEVGKDIEIQYIGLRPGEKLYEELLMAEEGLRETENKKIHVAQSIDMDDDYFEKELMNLKTCAYNEAADIRECVAKLVPTYHPKTGE